MYLLIALRSSDSGEHDEVRNLCFHDNAVGMETVNLLYTFMLCPAFSVSVEECCCGTGASETKRLLVSKASAPSQTYKCMSPVGAGRWGMQGSVSHLLCFHHCHECKVICTTCCEATLPGCFCFFWGWVFVLLFGPQVVLATAEKLFLTDGR